MRRNCCGVLKAGVGKQLASYWADANLTAARKLAVTRRLNLIQF
jgi:hypothetical protein